MKNSTVKDIVLAVTYRCNSRCRMCGIWQINDHTEEMLLKSFENLPHNLKNLNLSGGEPFLRSDLPEIVAVSKKACPGVRITISSNGFATDWILKKTKDILKIDPDLTIALSLDGVGETHDEVRGIEGGYEKTMNTLRGLKKLGVKNLRLAFTVGDYNYRELKKVYALAAEEGVEMTLAAVHSSENFFGKDNPIAAAEEIARELSWLIGKELESWQPKRWLRAYFAYGLVRFVKTGQRILPDYSGIDNVFIDPKGDIYPCDISNQKIGNLKEGFILKKFDKKECAKSWMICTAREAMRRHWLRVGLWILKNKFFPFSAK